MMAVVSDKEPHTTADEHSQRRSTSGVPGWVKIAALAIFLAVALVILYGYLTRRGWVGVADKRFWDYLELLIVPAALALGVYWLNRAQSEREREAEAAQRERALEVENQRAQEAVLQAYLDRMSELLLDKNLHKKDNPYDPTRVTARARTLAVLRQLDGHRKRVVLLFLRESRLINSKARCWGGQLAAHARLVGLENADLRNADLKGARLISTLRREAVSLEGADLENADLADADLERADLRKVRLKDTNLKKACLKGADLRGAKGITNEGLARQAASLEGATMPNGQKYEDWLKSREEEGENNGSS